MEPWDDRGQSIQIGAVLIFAALILLLSLYQATIVPQQNKQVEFDHSQQVQGDLLEFRNAVTSTFGESASRSVSIRLGTTYPSRVIAVNPPPVSGLLRTAGTTDADVSFALSNVEALDGEADDFWDSGSPREYGTGAVVYRPGYNEYGQPPRTVYDSTVLYDNFTFEGATLARSDQTLVDGSTISLVALNGSLQRSSSEATSVDVRPVSASSTTVTVTNRAAGDPVTIRTATRLPRSTWTELLADEANVTDVRTSSLAVDGFRTLEIDLRPGTYQLRMAKAGVGTRVGDSTAAYMTDVAADGSTVPEDGSVRLTVEVRDAYNNPVAGVNVTGESTDTAVGTLDSGEVTTGDDGRAAFQFEAKSVGAATDVPVEFNFTLDPTTPASFDPGDPEDVEVVVSVQNTQVPGGSGGGGAPYSLEWTTPSADRTFDSWDDGGTLSMTALLEDLDSTLANRTVDGARVDFAVNNSTVATLSPRTGVTDGSGEARATLTAQANGTVRVYAVSGGASDVVNVTVTNVTSGSGGNTGGGGTFAARVDDLTDVDTSRPEYVVSFDARSVSGADHVRVTFDNDDGAAQTRSSSSGDLRGHVRMSESTGDFTYDLTIEVLDSSGTVLTQEVVSDTANAVNPNGNDDLSQSGSAALVDAQTSIEDKSGSGSNVRYRYSYAITNTGDFSEVYMFALSRESGGDSGIRERTQTSGKNLEITFTYGNGNEYRVGFLVFDASGAVVDLVQNSGVETADGNGPVALTSALVLFALGITGVRRRFDR